MCLNGGKAHETEVPGPHGSHMQPWHLCCSPPQHQPPWLVATSCPCPGVMLVTTNMLGALLLATAGTRKRNTSLGVSNPADCSLWPLAQAETEKGKGM